MVKQAQTVEEVVSRLNALTEHDPEEAHAEADKLLLDALLTIKNGHKIVSAYMDARERVGFWYA